MKLNWFEEVAIYIVVFGLTFAIYTYLLKGLIAVYGYGWWLDFIIIMIVFLGISNLLIRIIQGKDYEEKTHKKI